MSGERRRALRRRKLIGIVLHNWNRCGACFHVREQHEDGTGHCTCGCKRYDPKARTRW